MFILEKVFLKSKKIVGFLIKNEETGELRYPTYNRLISYMLEEPSFKVKGMLLVEHTKGKLIFEKPQYSLRADGVELDTLLSYNLIQQISDTDEQLKKLFTNK